MNSFLEVHYSGFFFLWEESIFLLCTCTDLTIRFFYVIKSSILVPAYTQIQPHSLVQQHKQQQFVIQQTQASQRTQGQLLQTASIQPHLQTTSLVPHSPSQPGPIPVLPKPTSHHQPTTPSQQATIFHSTISPHALHSNLSQAKAQPVQLTAINLQIQPAPSQVSTQQSQQELWKWERITL